MKRNLARLFTLLLLAGVSVAWAGEDSDAAKPDNDDAVITQPAKPSSPAKPAKPASPTRPSGSDSKSDRPGQSDDDEDRFDNPSVRPGTVIIRPSQGRAPATGDETEIDVERGTRAPRQGDTDRPPRVGRGGNQPRGGSQPRGGDAAGGGRRDGGQSGDPHWVRGGRRSGHRGSYGPPPSGWGSGHHWGRRDRWRYDRWHYYGHWRFIWHWGPIVYVRPIVVDPVVRIPRSRVGVYVRQTGDDWVGEDFAREIRSQLRDVGLKPVYSPGDAELELFIVSMDQDPEDPGYGSAISISYIWKPGNRFITAQMLDVGRREIEPLAWEVVGYVDDLVDQYR